MDENRTCPECGKPIAAGRPAASDGRCLACNIKLSEKVPCKECGKPVLARQAGKRGGLCLRCSANHNPFFVLYSSLVDRVCSSPGGFDSLSHAEKAYYALTLFQNELNNGGFHQFFFNSSGSYYEVIENGLVTLNEQQVLALLREAKQIVFPGAAVPVDMNTRRELMHIPDADAPGSLMKKLDELDQRFYKTPNTLSPKLQAFAREQELVPGENS